MVDWPSAAAASRAWSTDNGWAPGVSRHDAHWLLPGRAPPARAWSRPARSSDDFPLPDGPPTTKAARPWSRATSWSTSSARPKKRDASAGWNAASPLYGQVAPASTGTAADAPAVAAAVAAVAGWTVAGPTTSSTAAPQSAIEGNRCSGRTARPRASTGRHASGSPSTATGSSSGVGGGWPVTTRHTTAVAA